LQKARYRENNITDLKEQIKTPERSSGPIDLVLFNNARPSSTSSGLK